MEGINPTLLVITLNLKGLNNPKGRDYQTGWKKKKDLTPCSLQEISFRFKYLKVTDGQDISCKQYLNTLRKEEQTKPKARIGRK